MWERRPAAREEARRRVGRGGLLRRPASLRTQLVAGSVGVVLLTFSLLSILLAAFFGRFFAAARVSALAVRARNVAALLRLPPGTADPRIATLVGATGGHVWVIDSGGRVLRQFGPPRFGVYGDWVSPAAVDEVLSGRLWTGVAAGRGRAREPVAVAGVRAPAARGARTPGPFAVVWVAPVGGGVLQQAVIARVVAVAALGLVFAAGLFLWLSQRLTDPIGRLERSARRLAAGDFAIAVDEAGPAEVRSLARSLREMAARLGEVDIQRRRFLADVSHELRSPLAALRGAVEGLRSPAAGRGERERYLGLAAAEAARLGRLVEDLLALARSQAGRLDLRRGPVDLHEAVMRVALSLEPLAVARGVAFRFDAPDGPALVDADPDRLSQVLWNLLDNAARHAPPGAEAWVATSAQGDRVRLEVGNPGSALDPDEVAHLFERFQRGRVADLGGTGLGLAIARALAEAHGALLTAEAPPEGGLRVILLWPAAAAA